VRLNPSLAALALLLAASAAPATAAPSAGVALTPCTLAHPSAPARLAARCGTLEVPEDRTRPAGRKVTLAIAVIGAEKARAASDPVFVLAGGPGQSIRAVFPAIAPAFGRISASRDLVLVDQRGTGGSSRLACSALEAPERVLEDAAKQLATV
jgi:pimeloyl-ACP methyl ester carboxylesterase